MASDAGEERVLEMLNDPGILVSFTEADEDEDGRLQGDLRPPEGHASQILALPEADNPGPRDGTETALGLASPSSPSKRPRSSDGDEIEPVCKQQHSGMFREQTLAHVSRVTEQLRTWSTAKNEAPDAELVLEILEELADCVVDERVLERTGIGREVASLQKHGDQEVAQRSKSLVVQWKRDRETRNKVVNSFIQKAQLTRKDAKKLEDGLFFAACPLGYLEADGYRNYHKHFLRLSTHLRKKGPGSLFQRLKDQELEPSSVAFLPDDDLITAEQKERIEADRKAGLEQAVASTEPEGTVSSEYMCPRCQSSHTIYKDVQTGWHSDQQDVTIIVCCLDCGERWKASDDHGVGS